MHGKRGWKCRPPGWSSSAPPKVGTNLMLRNPGIATELPLRIAVWEDGRGSTWISFPHMEKIARAYGVEDMPAIAAIRKLLRDIASQAANVY